MKSIELNLFNALAGAPCSRCHPESYHIDNPSFHGLPTFPPPGYIYDVIIAGWPPLILGQNKILELLKIR